MSLKIFLILIVLGTIFSWIAWGMVIFYFDPEKIDVLGFGIFYLSLFLGLSGLFFSVSNWLKAKIFQKQLLLFLGLTYRIQELLKLPSSPPHQAEALQ